jgi:hypothetical protein
MDWFTNEKFWELYYEWIIFQDSYEADDDQSEDISLFNWNLFWKCP